MADCLNPIYLLSHQAECAGAIVHAPANAIGSAANSAMNDLAQKVFEGLGKILTMLITVWRNDPGADLSGPNSAVHVMNQYLTEMTVFALVIGTIIAGVRLALQARADEEGKLLLRGLLLTIVVVGFGGGLITVLRAAFDQLGNSVLDGSLNGTNVNQRIGEFVAGTGGIPVLGSALAFFLYLLALLATLGQYAIMIMRNPILVLLCGVWPVFAASAITRTGGEWFKKITAWILSFAAYKLVAAIVYATAFSLIGTGNDASDLVNGGVLLILAVLALPAMLRLISPMASAIPSGSGITGGVVGGVIASGAVATAGGGMKAGSGMVGSVSPASAGAEAATGAASAAPAAAGAAAAATGGASIVPQLAMTGAQKVGEAANSAANDLGQDEGKG